MLVCKTRRGELAIAILVTPRVVIKKTKSEMMNDQINPNAEWLIPIQVDRLLRKTMLKWLDDIALRTTRSTNEVHQINPNAEWLIPIQVDRLLRKTILKWLDDIALRTTRSTNEVHQNSRT
jgi:hypothetical protein